jgi:hypothetical protein
MADHSRIEASFLQPTDNGFVGKAEAGMLRLIAQLLEGVRREVDDQESPARSQKARTLGDGGSGRLRVM